MPRKSFAIRHLKARPPDEDTASKYFREWPSAALYHAPDTFPKVSSQALFGNDKPLELEVGCGTGEFLLSLAEREPGTNFVGIDISLKSIYIAVEKARWRKLDNVKFVKAAMQLVYQLLPPESLRAIYLHFPDPCLHPKYRPRRLFTPEFLDNVYQALTPEGHLSVMTDVPALFDRMLALAESDPRFEKAHPERYLVGFDEGAKSRYQAIWERHGTAPLRFLLRKRAELAADQT
jgi:tRNA (guanine-N7-)-methyltransferase